MPTIYYIRHGQTDWNVAGRFQGSQDIPLNDLGRSQAGMAGDILRRLLAADGHDATALPFISSPLGRARQTMELVRGTLAVPVDDYSLDDRLREISYGRWEGSTTDQMRMADPDVFVQREIDKWGVSPPGGESYVQVTDRVRDWYDSLSGDNVTVAHGGTLRALLVALGISEPWEVADRFIEQGAVYVVTDSAVTLHR